MRVGLRPVNDLQCPPTAVERRRARWQLHFDYQPTMLNQFLINKNMATGDAPIKVDPATR